MAPEPAVKPATRRLRFGVRALMAFVLVVGGGLGWIVYKARVQHDAVEAIQRAGGRVVYDWESQNHKPWWPKRLADRIGVDYFGSVVSVHLHARPPIQGIDSLMAHVARLDRVESLMLAESRVTDVGLTHLEGLTRLKSLFLQNTRVTDAGLAHLQRLTGLSTLYLHDTLVTDAGLAHLKNLKKLQQLTLYNTRVTDAGLTHLAGLTDLEFLSLHVTRVGDAGLAHLKGLSRLKELDVCDTQVTKAGREAFQRARPKTWIVWDLESSQAAMGRR